jgi:ribonuclease E
MGRLLLINAAEPEETRAALVEEGRLEEFRAERTAQGSLVGNIYKGRVVNLETGIGAAFIDIGVGRNGFLHISACPGAGPGARIEERFTVGGDAIVQVTRESIGSKGPMLSGDLSLPGRFLVLLPYAQGGGVSRRIGDGEDRTKLRELARDLERRAGAGLIVRTAAADRGSRELLRDLRQLKRVWASVEAKAAREPAPAVLYEESDLVARALRDLVDRDVREIVVDTPEALARAREMVSALQPELAERLRLHAGGEPLFHAQRIEEQVDELRARRVRLPGGGSVVFDMTEALVAVDVNSGRTREDELEETALRTNLEAAEVIARQIRLRDLGGVIVVDFIDLRDAAHGKAVDKAFKAALACDRARVRPGRFGDFGIFAVTRQRTGYGAPRRPCPRCGGTGTLVHPEEVALRVFRELRARTARRGKAAIRARVSPEVAETLGRTWKGQLEALGEETGRKVEVLGDPALPADGWAVEAG